MLKSLKPLAALASALVLITSCATGSIYYPAASERGTGYREVQIETGRYRVTFTGTPYTAASTVQDYALLRAAELTLNMGFDWFRVVSRSTVSQDTSVGSRPARVSPMCGIYGCRSRIYGGVIFIDDFDDDRVTASVEIVMGKNPKPDDPDVYDAQDVANTIRSRMN